jgi:hypothetical protein
MRARLLHGLRWLTGIAVVLTLWWGWQLQRERVVLHSLTRTATDVHQRIAQLRSEIARVQRVDRGTLDSLAHAAQTLQRVVQQLQQQELTVALTCQKHTNMTLAALSLVARPCQITIPPTGMLAVIEVIHAIEQTQVILPRVRLHVTEGMTMDVQVIGPVEQTMPHTLRRDTE